MKKQNDAMKAEHDKFFRTYGAEGTPPPEVCPPIKGSKEKFEMEITVHFYENLEPCEVAPVDCKPGLSALRLKKQPEPEIEEIKPEGQPENS